MGTPTSFFWEAAEVPWARDRTCATAANYTVPAAMLDLLTHCTSLGIEPDTSQQPELLQLDSLPTVPQWDLLAIIFQIMFSDFFLSFLSDPPIMHIFIH